MMPYTRKRSTILMKIWSKNIFLPSTLKVLLWGFTRNCWGWNLSFFLTLRLGRSRCLCMRSKMLKLSKFWGTFTLICIQDLINSTMRHVLGLYRGQKSTSKFNNQLQQLWLISILQKETSLPCSSTEKSSPFSTNSGMPCTKCALRPTSKNSQELT